ncbi:MAG: GNAT family N-acetyltransferase [Chthoniobacterales bacterium]|nr:GNAT family N-acetyltransferase [Chthoniobacterales bacterium]
MQDYPAWTEAFEDKCKDHRFYELISATLMPEFDYRFIVLEAEDHQVRAIQPLFFLRQNLTEGVRGFVRDAIERIRRKFPRFLTMKTLMVGCSAGEGHLGACRPEDAEWTAEALHHCLKPFARAAGASLIVVKDFSARYRGPMRSFSLNGYTRIASMPMTRLSLHHRDFEEYLASLGKATRKNLRRKFRATAQHAPITLEVLHDVTSVIGEIYPLYLAVHERSKMHFEKLTPDYFCGLGQEMPDRARFFIWRQEGKAIAFSLCLVHEGVIYDDYLGLDYSIAFDLNLYFYTIRDIISWALAQGLHSYCSSPLNYEPKLHLGCDLVPLDLYIMHTSAGLNPIFRRALRFLQPTRHDPVLKLFPNAAEL